jgi:hypothetical protein
MQQTDHVYKIVQHPMAETVVLLNLKTLVLTVIDKNV